MKILSRECLTAESELSYNSYIGFEVDPLPR
jgi:hypothetical protein